MKVLPIINTNTDGFHTVLISYDTETDVTLVTVDGGKLPDPLDGKWVLSVAEQVEGQGIYWSITDNLDWYSSIDSRVATREKVDLFDNDYTILSLLSPRGVEFLTTQKVVMDSSEVSEVLKFIKECSDRKVEYNFSVVH